ETAHLCSPEERAQKQLRRAREQLDRLEQAVSAGQFDQQGLISLAMASAALQQAASRLHATAVSSPQGATEPRNQAATGAVWSQEGVAPPSYEGTSQPRWRRWLSGVRRGSLEGCAEAGPLMSKPPRLTGLDGSPTSADSGAPTRRPAGHSTP